MAGFTGAAATNARSAVASRALVADGNEKTQSRLLPSAVRRRSLRSGSVPAVSPPALHFTARRTADRSSSSGTRPALRRTFTSRLKSAAPKSANPHPTILRQKRRKRPTHAAKSPAFSGDAMRETSRPKQTNLVSLVQARTKEKIGYYPALRCRHKLVGKKAIALYLRRIVKYSRHKCCNWQCCQFR